MKKYRKPIFTKRCALHLQHDLCESEEVRILKKIFHLTKTFFEIKKGADFPSFIILQYKQN